MMTNKCDKVEIQCKLNWSALVIFFSSLQHKTVTSNDHGQSYVEETGAEIHSDIE